MAPFFFLYEEKGNFYEAVYLKNTDFHKTHDYRLFPVW